MDNTCDLGGNLMTHESSNMELRLEKTQALIKALVLAVTAPSDAKSKEVVKIAEGLANGMCKSDVEYCKEMAADRLKYRIKH